MDALIHKVHLALGGKRLDRALTDALPQFSRARIQALLAQGMVRSEGVVVQDASRKVQEGEAFEVCEPPAVEALPEAQAIPLEVVYEDDDLLVINKPAGLVVHPAAGNADGTLVNALLAHCGDSLSGIGGVKRPGIVHRLDKDTTGLMVVAKNDAAHHGLSAQLSDRSLTRVYVALVWKGPSQAKGRIEGAIGRNPHDRKKMALVSRGGKEAVTDYAVLAHYGAWVSLVECRLKTGRTHQIRVHMASMGCPLVGDQTYGHARKTWTRGLAPDVVEMLSAFPRQALHAREISFLHPRSGERMRFESFLPDDMQTLLDALNRILK